MVGRTKPQFRSRGSMKFCRTRQPFVRDDGCRAAWPNGAPRRWFALLFLVTTYFLFDPVEGAITIPSRRACICT